MYKQRVVAFIPVRGGSKSIPQKNIKLLCGKPLVYWTLKAAVESQLIDLVYVATEDEKIRNTVQSFGLPKVKVIGRSIETATDYATTESAMLEFANTYDFEFIVLIQATSPLLTTEYLDQGIMKILSTKVDSVLSVVRQKRFIWKEDGLLLKPENYFPEKRPRRQEFPGFLVENGAFYITSRERLLTSRCRISGKVAGIEMPEETYYELDEPQDWIVIEQLLKNRLRGEDLLLIKDKAKRIRMVLTDCDGVLTDGGMYYSENGDELKKFNTRDGMAVKLLQNAGIKVGIITGEKRELIRARASKLQVDVLYMGTKDKKAVLEQIKEEFGLTKDEIAYIGDDQNDLEVLMRVGLACVPADAIDSVKKVAHYIAKAKGGEGVLREIADLILGTN